MAIQEASNQENDRENMHPRQWLGVLADLGFQAIDQYLKSTNAPAELLDLSQGLHVINTYLETDTRQQLPGGGDDMPTWAAGAIGRGIFAAGEVVSVSPEIVYSGEVQ